MSIRKAIVIVESPLQLLNARELIYKYNIKNTTVFIRCNPNRKNNEEQLVELSNSKLFSDCVVEFKFIHLTNSVFNFPKEFLAFIKYRASQKDVYDICVLGDLRIPWIRWYGLSINAKRIVIIDDGMAALVVRDEILNKNNFKYRENHKLYSFTGFVKRLISLSYSIFMKTKITMKNTVVFSAFIAPTTTQYNVVKNKFSYLLSANKKKNQVNELWYFGSPLSERNVIDFHTEISLLKFVMDFSKNKNLTLYYYSHRDDSKIKLCEIEKLGVAIVSACLPAELMLARSDRIPLIIGASGSSVLITFSNFIAPSALMNFSIPTQLINKDYRSSRKLIDEELRVHHNINEQRFCSD